MQSVQRSFSVARNVLEVLGVSICWRRWDTVRDLRVIEGNRGLATTTNDDTYFGKSEW